MLLFPTEIIENVKNGLKPAFRPTIDEGMGDEAVIHMMKRCWNEDPAERPDFSTLKTTIRRLNK